MSDTIISALLQIFVFTLIPFLVYIISKRKISGFFSWIGLKASTRKANLYGLLTSIIFIASAVSLTFISEDIESMLKSPETISGQFREMGWSSSTVILLLITAILKTSFSEEVFFRGFVAKRFISWLGFRTGNIVQAIIFGTIHLVLFLALEVSIIFPVFIFIFSGLGAYITTWINEKYGNGSIIPGWIAHGTGNAVSYYLLAFVL